MQRPTTSCKVNTWGEKICSEIDGCSSVPVPISYWVRLLSKFICEIIFLPNVERWVHRSGHFPKCEVSSWKKGKHSSLLCSVFFLTFLLLLNLLLFQLCGCGCGCRLWTVAITYTLVINLDDNIIKMLSLIRQSETIVHAFYLSVPFGSKRKS